MRQLIKPILAGLLECNISKAMKFEDFFSKVDYIVNLKPLRLFKPKDASEIILYVAKTDRYVYDSLMLFRPIGFLIKLHRIK